MCIVDDGFAASGDELPCDRDGIAYVHTNRGSQLDVVNDAQLQAVRRDDVERLVRRVRLPAHEERGLVFDRARYRHIGRAMRRDRSAGRVIGVTRENVCIR